MPDADLNPFLRRTEVIDWGAAPIRQLAEELQQRSDSELELARLTFDWVRDEIEHSLDVGRTEVTCRASDVLSVGAGLCFAKSHLLAALLRANGIPVGFCYQRLICDEGPIQYCLHGLNAIHLPQLGWYRVDARGNKAGVEARFDPPDECLAFSVGGVGERDIPAIFAEPLDIVVNSLLGQVDMHQVVLPDLAAEEEDTLLARSRGSMLFRTGP